MTPTKKVQVIERGCWREKKFLRRPVLNMPAVCLGKLGEYVEKKKIKIKSFTVTADPEIIKEFMREVND